MKIKYLFHDESNTATYAGDGTMDSFGTGMSMTSHHGTFTNTSNTPLTDQVMVIAALTQKSANTIKKMNQRINDDETPVNVFFFIPTVAYATWHPVNATDLRFWASLPLFRMKPGKTYDGYYVPLTALPPFGSRAEIGTIEPNESLSISAADYFLFAAAYFDYRLKTVDARREKGKKYITITGGQDGNYKMDYVMGANASLSLTFSQMIYQAAAGDTPNVQMHIDSIESTDGGGFRVNLAINTKAMSGKPRIAIKQSVDKSGRHGLDIIGNSGFINNKDISLDCIITKRNLPKNLKEIRINNKPRTVAGVDYYDKNQKRINLYLSL